MEWPRGLTWIEGYEAITTNPDGTTEKIRVHGGPFYYNPRLLYLPVVKRWVFVYAGFRPTPTWGPGYGDEGVLGFVGRWMKKVGWGNFGWITVRLKK